MDISVIIVNYNLANFIVSHIHRLFAEDLRVEVIIVDNSANKKERELLKEIPFPVTLIFNDENKGFAKACNDGVEHAKAPYIFFLNPDAYIIQGCLSTLLNVAQKIGCDAIGPKIFLDDDLKIPQPPFYLPILINRIFHNLFPKFYHFFWKYYSLQFWKIKKIKRIHFLSGAAFLIKKQFARFDERFFLYFEDADLFFRLKKAKRKVFFCPLAKVVHYFDLTPAQNKNIYFQDSQKKFYQKHYYFTQGLFYLSEKYKRTFKCPSVFFNEFNQQTITSDIVDLALSEDFVPFVRVCLKDRLPSFIERYKSQLRVLC